MKPAADATPDDLSSAQVVADPFPAYRRLRDRAPFRYTHLPAGAIPGEQGPTRAWAVMRFDDVDRALRDHETFSSRRPHSGKLLPRMVLLQDDPPRHTRFRRLVNRTFTPKRVEALRPQITRIADRLLADIPAESVDLIRSYAVPLPMRVISRLIGIPEENHAVFRQWTEAALSFVPASPKAREHDLERMTDFLRQMVAQRRHSGADDLITTLVEARPGGDALEEWEIVGFLVLLLIAGNETTTGLLGNMLNILADRPRLWRRLRDDRRLVDPLIEETLRYESPVQRLSRVTTREVELSGVTIPRDESVVLFFGAANRDPAHFSDPDEFRLDRPAGDHLAFGAGVHFCLGARLAMTEAAITLHAFLDRFSEIARGDRPAVRQTSKLLMLGFDELPLVLRPI